MADRIRQTPHPGLPPAEYVVPSFDNYAPGLIFRHQCWCGAQSSWRDTPDEALADRPARCKAHDTPTPGDTP